MSVLTGVGGAALTGNWPGYVLTFHRVGPGGTLLESAPVVLHSDVYEAEIDVGLAGGIERTGASIVLVGLSDADHRQLAERAGGAPVLAVVRVHLFWRDANRTVGGYLDNLLGAGGLDAVLSAAATGGSATDGLRPVRIADLTVTGVSRRRGTRRYETVITGVERIRARTSVTLSEPVSVTGLGTAARKLADLAGIPVRVEPIVAATATDPDGLPFTAARGQSVRTALNRLGERIEQVTGKYGRGMLMIQDGVLHVGPRPIPLGADPWPLSWSTGLLSVEALAPYGVDPAADPETADLAGPVPRPGNVNRRDQWKITLRGRPDIKPGHVVSVVPPPGEGDTGTEPGLGAALFGGFAAPLLDADDGAARVTGYVTGVSHRLDRSAGFITVLTALALGSGDDGWDQRPAPTTTTQAKGDTGAAEERPTGAARLGSELDRKIAERLATVEIAEVGEVRAVRPASDGPRADTQRLTLWQGTDPATDGDTAAAVRLPIERRQPLEKTGVPYATPFAWGKCGLVLPRYPGTRMLSLYRHGLPEDPVAVGALWSAGEGPDAHAGDWWLSLPVGVPEQKRTSVDHTQTPAAHTGPVSNDLVDADGHRVIEVANLRVRIGADGLNDAGTRPEPAPDDTVLSIEHSDGTTVLTIDKNGAVHLVAKGALHLSGNGISLDAGSGDVSIKAANVAVKVSQQMTVD
jgi:hypothetical protein